MAEFTKAERAKLRDLAGEAYERELGQALQELAESFERWRKGKLLSSELSEEIHEFHQRPARELWSMYQSLGPELIVSRALEMGLLSEGEVTSAIRSKLGSERGIYKGRRGAA